MSNVLVNGGCINKKTFNVFYDKDSARYLGEVLEKEEYKFLLDLIGERRDLVVFDVGANIGTFSFYIYDVAKVIYAFEPFPEVIELLKGTIKENKLKKIKPQTMALGNFTGSGLMARNEPVSSGGSMLSDVWIVESSNLPGYQQVPVMTLNDFCEKEGITHIDLLKIDTEGTELDILGSIDFDKLSVDYIIGEYHQGKVNKHSLFSYLDSKGFKSVDVDGKHFSAKHV